MSTEHGTDAESRDMIYLLVEAAEIEHNLMCCYLSPRSAEKPLRTA